MEKKTGFYAFPSGLPQVQQTIESACSQVGAITRNISVMPWPEIEDPGRFIRETVLAHIDGSDFVVADITELNFNVTYEIGYAIGRSKPVYLTRNTAFAKNDEIIREIGIFDTILWESYENSANLLAFLRSGISERSPKHELAIELDYRQPVFLVQPRYRTDGFQHLLSRLSKAKLNLRSFDPAEQPRLGAPYAIREVARSHGIVVHFADPAENGALVHNQRSAFIAGLSDGMAKAGAYFQSGEGPIPLDYRDFVTSYMRPASMDEVVGEFAASVAASLQRSHGVSQEPQKSQLESLDIGASSAENESASLSEYFVQTDAFTRALSGQVRLVVGRKGVGKTATFLQLKERMRRGIRNLVLDLKPDGYKLIKLRESVLDLMQTGTFEHTITAFWEYLLLLEIGFGLLEADAQIYARDMRLVEPYRSLEQELKEVGFGSTCDFSDRLAELIDRIVESFEKTRPQSGQVSMANPEVTALIHGRDIQRLRSKIQDYLRNKESVWILFDNLDKGWPTRGLSDGDVRIISTLVEATRKIERELQNSKLDVHSLIFLRNDVYELLVDATPDRGKEKRILLDWYEPELLKELVRKRFEASGLPNADSFDIAWRQICVSHVDGEDSFQYLVDRSLMRPRYLIDLINYCKSFAINLHHVTIDADDIKRGVSAFSADIFEDISLEIRDVNPKAADVLYALVGIVGVQGEDDIKLRLMESGFAFEDGPWLIDLLLWYGVLGMVEGNLQKYIYDYKYNWKLLEAHLKRSRVEGARLVVNPAFVDALTV